MPLAFRRLRAVPALAAAIAAVLTMAPGCQSVTPPASSFVSEPPGARVLINGQDSGWVTPCLIALDHESAHQVSIELEGYAPYRVQLAPSYRRHVVDWQLGASGAQSTIVFPLFLPPGDLFVPFRVNRALQPARVFARLRSQEDSKDDSKEDP